MVDLKYINKGYKQQGNVCTLASYAIVIEHYSQGTIDKNKVFASFVNFFPDLEVKIKKTLAKTLPVNRRGEKEKLIYNEFIHYCQQVRNDIRGFDFFVELHDTDILETLGVCNVIKSNAQTINLPDAEVLELRDNLKLGGLAMIMTNNGAHAIVVGYDLQKQEYFKRDTNDTDYEFEDFLSSNKITEYIWFSNNPQIIENFNNN